MNPTTGTTNQPTNLSELLQVTDVGPKHIPTTDRAEQEPIHSELLSLLHDPIVARAEVELPAAPLNQTARSSNVSGETRKLSPKALATIIYRLEPVDLLGTIVVDQGASKFALNSELSNALKQIEEHIVEEVTTKTPTALTSNTDVFDGHEVIRANGRLVNRAFASYGKNVNEITIQAVLVNIIELLRSNPERIVVDEVTQGDISNLRPSIRLQKLAYATEHTIPGMELVKGVLNELAQKVLDREEAKRKAA